MRLGIPRLAMDGLIPGAAGGGGGGSSDPNFGSVSLLLRMDGANDGTVFTDSSANNFPMTSTGAVTKTAIAKFGTASALITSGALNFNNVRPVSSDAKFLAQTENFTIELWFYVSSAITFDRILYQNRAATANYPYQLVVTSANNVRFNGRLDSVGTTAFDITATGHTIVSNTWYFVQARRSGETFSLAIDGVEYAAVTLAGPTTLWSTASVVIGNNTSGSTNPFPGYIDEVRFTKGVARPYSLPTAPFPSS